jgi:serine/threonine protein kinase/tetratricopeptide (TPR) repeat protein
VTDEPSTGHLTPEAFAKIREVFAATCDLPHAERTAAIQNICAGNEAIGRAVEELLVAHDHASATLDPDNAQLGRHILELSQPSNRPEHIGPYRITGTIGQGGMGIVYLAQQSNPQREVALKIVRRGHNSGSILTRFGREIRVLGRLEHPCITRIYEAGTATIADEPVEYFAMEYVRGQRLTDAADTLKLDLAARVELVAKVADAVQHAHTKGVIHRDLKPANILVSDTSSDPSVTQTDSLSSRGGPQPKILDFGVARLLEPETQYSAVTEAGLVIGTIGYMSPEQVGGDTDAVDARSDVYAMGVILYELLTGRMPHELRSKQIAEAARIVRDDAPAPLNATGNRTRRLFSADLETIVLHAMEKDRERRYPTAAALADDLRRFLRNETILARPPSATYQFAMFTRRNRGLVSGVAAALLATIAGLVFSTVMYSRAELARADAAANGRLSSAVRDYMIDGLLMAASPDRQGYEVKMLDVLTNASDGLHERFAKNPEVEGSIRADLANVLTQIGKQPESKKEYLLAIPLLEKAVGHDAELTIKVLNGYSATLQDLHENEEWLRVARDNLARAERVLPELHPNRLHAMTNVGGSLVTLARYDEARPVLEQAYQRGLAAKNFEVQSNANSWLIACERAAGNKAVVLEMRRRAYDDIVAELGPDHRNSLISRSNYAVALLQETKIDEAVKVIEGLPEAVERQYPPGHPIRAMVYGVASIIYGSANQYERAEVFCVKAYDLQTSLVKEFDWMTEQRIHALRQLYARWPGHHEQLITWSLHGIKGRMMLAHDNEQKNLPDVLDAVLEHCKRAELPMERKQLLDLVWQRRDELAPQGHPRRAAFYGNFARASHIERHRSRFAEAMSLANESLAYATEADVARGIIAAATAMTADSLTTPPPPAATQ